MGNRRRKYKIIFGRNNLTVKDRNREEHGEKRAGVAIAIKMELLPLVKNVYKIDGMAMEMRIKTCKSINDISILNTYAPHIGYSEDVLKITGKPRMHTYP